MSTSFSKTTTPFHLPHSSIKSGAKGNEKPPRKNYIVSFVIIDFRHINTNESSTNIFSKD